MNKSTTSSVLGREISDFIDLDTRRADYPGWPDSQAIRQARTHAARHRNAAFRGTGRAIAAFVRGGWNGAARRLTEWRENRVAAAALSKLSERTLRDIGVHQSDIAQLRSGQLSVMAFNAEREARGRNRGRLVGRDIADVSQIKCPEGPAANQSQFAHAA